ncbi:hypothetical protein FRC02_009635 [Tulasnella sp. 418]|nr:hypothetical protein FRC02_009635 [Tulasnella sp. 418]
MSILSASLRSKPSWWIKYRDPSIRSKWKSEALEQVVLEGKLNEAEVDYVLAELEGYELLRDENTGAEVACFERIWQSDSLVPIDLRQLLVTEIAKLEDIPDEKKDWHPRSDNLVLDLVHPSLYCLVYGRTYGYTPGSDPRKRAPSDLQLLSPPEAPKKYSIQSLTGPDEYCISRKFSWIPTDFHIDDSGEGARAKSYINNLHPSHTELYHGIEMLIAKFSQLFNRVLTDLHPDNPLKQRTVGCYHYEDNGGRPRRRDGEDWDAYYLRLNEWEKNRPIVLPTVPTDGYSGGLNIRKSQYSIHGRDVQVIVKLANIQLTPEKPEYPGGSWHVEGMANECIVASGIYYYSSKNITSSHLAFRESVSFDEPYEQNDDEGVKKTWGLIR